MSDWAVPNVQNDFDAEEIVRDASLSEEEKKERLHKGLVDAAQNGSLERVHELLGDGLASEYVDKDRKDMAGSNALLYSSCFGHESIVTELLRYGANVDVQDQNEWTPLMWAIQNQHLGIVEKLIESGADTSITTSTGRKAVDFCQPGTAISSLLSSRGLIETARVDDFYQATQDPADIEARLARDLEDSSDALGLRLTNLTFAEEGDLAPGMGFTQAEVEQDSFDWNHYRLDQSLVLNVRDIPRFLEQIVTNATPSLKKNQLPMSANAIFLAARYYHYNGPEDAFVSLFTPLGRRILNVVEEHKNDLTFVTYWLVNTQVLFYYLKRDPGVDEASKNDFQPLLIDLVDALLQASVTTVQTLLDPLIKPCLLDYENIPGLNTIQYRGDWRLFHRQKKLASLEEDAARSILPPTFEALRKPAPRKVVAVLSSLLLVLDMFSVHPVISEEIFSQIFYWLSSRMFDSIMDNRKYLARARAMQIRLNLSNIEDWCRNNNRRPEESDELSGVRNYKSMLELCRTQFACTSEMLQWLQCFSGFDSDFTNVIATMQELKALNPKQLLHAAKNYRSEKHETALSRDYRDYLEELAVHYDVQLKNDDREKSTGVEKAAGASTSANQGKLACEADVTPEPERDTANLGNQNGQKEAPVSADEPKKDVQAVLDPAELATDMTNPIFRGAKPITTTGVLLDTKLTFPLYVPSLREMVAYWGGGLGGTDVHSLHYFVPVLSAELADQLDWDTTEGRVYDRVDMPDQLQHRIEDDEIELAKPIESAWTGDLDEPVWS